MKHLPKLPQPGLRIIKTALAVLCTLLLYEVIGRSGTALAAFAAVVCMQDSLDHSIKGGVNRILGTALGGLFGVMFTAATPLSRYVVVWAVAVSAVLVLLMYLCNLISKPESIVISSVVYLLIVIDVRLQVPIHPFSYALDRVLDTAIGVVIAVLVNLLVFRPKQSPGGGAGNEPSAPDAPEDQQDGAPPQ